MQCEKSIWVPKKVNNNVTKCHNCINSNCHQDCNYGDNETKKDCSAMDKNGNCTICPLKCSYLAHSNSHELRVTETII